jgi:hypothetical protein
LGVEEIALPYSEKKKRTATNKTVEEGIGKRYNNIQWIKRIIYDHG